MDAFPEAQNFLDGMYHAKKHKCVEEYGDIKYSKNNALRVSLHERDTEIMEI